MKFFKKSFFFVFCIFVTFYAFSENSDSAELRLNTKSSALTVENINLPEAQNIESKNNDAQNTESQSGNEQLNFYESETMSKSPTFANGLIATAETLASNVILASFNRFVLQKDFAKITWDSVYDNLSHQWVWDQDTFVVNQLGHPYQGSFYFAAGRANNFNFYESIPFNLIGSVTWEYLAELDRQAFNDLICTTFGGAALGEVFHRLYIEASSQKSIVAFLLSPMDALHSLITGDVCFRDTKQGVTSLENFVSFGGVFERTTSTHKNYDFNDDIIGNLTGGFNLVYGNPFNSEKTIPFSYFIFDLNAGGTLNYYQVRANIEGNLVRFGTKYFGNSDSSQSSFSAALGMTFKVDWTKITSYSVNGLGIILSAKNDLPGGFSLSQRLNLSGTFFATGDCYALYRDYVKLPNDGEERRLYDYGTGYYARYNFCASQKYFGKFVFDVLTLGLFDIETAVPSYGQKGATFITEAAVSYEHLVRKNISLGLKGECYFKYENNYGAENINERIYALNIYSSRKIR